MKQLIRWDDRYRRLCSFILVMAVFGCSAVPLNSDGANDPADFEGDIPPAIALLEPTDDLTLTAGEDLTVGWEDSDVDSNADISVLLFPASGTGSPTPGGSAKEDDDGPARGEDSIEVDTSTLEPGDYYIFVTINDGVNNGVSLFALNQAGDQLVVSVTSAEE